MLIPDPVGRITSQQIKSHPWLKSFELNSCVYYSEISIEIIEKLLKYPQFSSVSQKEAISFVQTKTQNDFTVAYNILYDSESKTNTKKKNKIVFPNKKKYEKSKPKTNKTLNTPSN